MYGFLYNKQTCFLKKKTLVKVYFVLFLVFQYFVSKEGLWGPERMKVREVKLWGKKGFRYNLEAKAIALGIGHLCDVV